MVATSSDLTPQRNITPQPCGCWQALDAGQDKVPLFWAVRSFFFRRREEVLLVLASLQPTRNTLNYISPGEKRGVLSVVTITDGACCTVSDGLIRREVAGEASRLSVPVG